MMARLSGRKLLDHIFNAAYCYIPTDLLTEEQLERLDNFRYRFCQCKMCERTYPPALTKVIPDIAGHANQRAWEIRISKRLFYKFLLKEPFIPIALLDYIETALHEIIHILYPDFSEEETEAKTFEWLKKAEWVDDLKRFDEEARRQWKEGT